MSVEPCVLHVDGFGGLNKLTELGLIDETILGFSAHAGSPARRPTYFFCECLSCESEARPHGIERNVNELGDGRSIHAIDLVEHEDFPLLKWNRLHRRFNQGFVLGRFDGFLRTIEVFGGFGCCFLECGELARGFDGDASRDWRLFHRARYVSLTWIQSSLVCGGLQ